MKWIPKSKKIARNFTKDYIKEFTWNNLEEFESQRGMLSDEVRIRVRSTEQLGNLPGIKDQELELEIRKNDRDALKKFEKAVAEYRAGQRQDNVDEMLDDIRDFLHGL